MSFETIVVNLELSKKLNELGVKPNTLIFVWVPLKGDACTPPRNFVDIFDKDEFTFNPKSRKKHFVIPAYTTDELLNLWPKDNLLYQEENLYGYLKITIVDGENEDVTGGFKVSAFMDGRHMTSCITQINPVLVDAIADLYIELIENGWWKLNATT